MRRLSRLNLTYSLIPHEILAQVKSRVRFFNGARPLINCRPTRRDLLQVLASLNAGPGKVDSSSPKNVRSAYSVLSLSTIVYAVRGLPVAVALIGSADRRDLEEPGEHLGGVRRFRRYASRYVLGDFVEYRQNPILAKGMGASLLRRVVLSCMRTGMPMDADQLAMVGQGTLVGDRYQGDRYQALFGSFVRRERSIVRRIGRVAPRTGRWRGSADGRARPIGARHFSLSGERCQALFASRGKVPGTFGWHFWLSGGGG